MDTVNKGIRFPVDLLQRIDALAKNDDRKFSEEVLHLCRMGIKVDAIQKGTLPDAIRKAADEKGDAGGGRRAQ